MSLQSMLGLGFSEEEQAHMDMMNARANAADTSYLVALKRARRYIKNNPGSNAIPPSHIAAKIERALHA